MSTYSNDLIYGKNKLERIVAIECNDNQAEVFTEDNDGNVSVQFLDHNYWLLSAVAIRGYSKLEGKLFYKYGKKFDNKRDWYLERSRLTGKDRNKPDVGNFYMGNASEALMCKEGLTYFKAMKPEEVSVLSFDLETTGLSPDDKDAKILLISNTIRKGNKIERYLFSYDDYDSQGEMLEDWCAFVCTMNPSVILGHNILSFDFPYIIGIADKEGIQLQLGRDGSNLHVNNYISDFRKESGQFIHYKGCHAYGRNIIDTLFLAIRYDVATRKYSSYALKNIIKQEGLEKEDRQFYDASTIRINYKNSIEWEKIKEYCRHDADDALALYDLMVPPFFYMNQSVPKTFEQMIASASGSQLNSMMVRAYLQRSHSIPKADEAVKFEGAISLGVAGIHSNVLSFDVASLYPSIMRQYKVCDEEKDPLKIMPEIVEFFTLERLKNKKLAKETGEKEYDHLQNSQKILVNSMYGFLGATGLNFNSPKNASFVTESGRNVLMKAIQWATGLTYEAWYASEGKDTRRFKIVACDTDSIFFKRQSENPWGKDQIQTLQDELNERYPELIKWEPNGCFIKKITLKAKNYALWDGEELKIKGSALRGSTREPALQELIKEMIDAMVFDKNNHEEIYLRYVKEALNVKDIKRWAFRKTITDAVLKSERMNEEKVRLALEDEDYQPGDRRYFFYRPDNSMCLVENFDGEYDKIKLVKRIYDTIKIFNTVIDITQFVKFHLKGKRKQLDELEKTVI